MQRFVLEEDGGPDTGVNYVRPFVEWCREKGVRGFVGEFGVPDTDASWLVTMDRFLAYLNANRVSGPYWSAGPWWGKHPMSIEPQNTEAGRLPDAFIDRPQMIVLRQYPGRVPILATPRTECLFLQAERHVATACADTGEAPVPQLPMQCCQRGGGRSRPPPKVSRSQRIRSHHGTQPAGGVWGQVMAGPVMQRMKASRSALSMSLSP